MTSDLLAMQAPSGVPRSSFFEVVSDPLLPPGRTDEMLAHFFEQIYDLSPESHLSRLLKVVLGDTGTGQLRKRYTYAHLSQFLATTKYHDLDRLYAQIFGLKRFIRERIDLDPYTGAATDEEWEAIDAADASYRARIQAFSHSLTMAGTPSGMVMAAEAVLGDDVRLYETYAFQDNEAIYAADEAASAKIYSDLEVGTYGDLEGMTYGELEGRSRFSGRLFDSRGEFVLRPLRTISAEEHYHLVRVLGRIKPAEALMTVDTRPARQVIPVPVARAAASSSYWHVQQRVLPSPEDARFYDRYDEDTPVEQPRLAMSAYQGEAMSYNGDVLDVTAYVEDADGTVSQAVNFDRVPEPSGRVVDYRPGEALDDQRSIMMGRYASDGVLSAPAISREAE